MTFDTVSFTMHGMAQQPTFPLYDRILGGRLTQLLLEWQAEGESTTEMTWKLRELDVHVHPMTVKRWLDKIDAKQAS